jgi:hypothetical protein
MSSSDRSTDAATTTNEATQRAVTRWAVFDDLSPRPTGQAFAGQTGEPEHHRGVTDGIGIVPRRP